MAWKPKVRRHGTILVQKTVGGNTAYVKRRPGVITSIAADTNPVFRVKHGGESYGTGATGVPQRKTLGSNRNGKFYPG